MTRSYVVALVFLVLIASAATVVAQPPMGIRLVGVTGNQNTPGGGLPAPDDNVLYEINLNNFSLTRLVQFPFVPDTIAIGFNPENGLLYRTGGAARIGTTRRESVTTTTISCRLST